MDFQVIAPVWRCGRRLAAGCALVALSASAAHAGPVAAGSNFVLVAMPDGSVVAWGGNGSGQLGQGNTQGKAVPTVVPGLANAVAVAAGGSHSLVLTSGGLLYSFGNNSSKQLGDNTTTQRTSPIGLFLTNVTQVAAGDYHSVALTSDGNVWTWGSNAYGELGHGHTTTVGTPLQVAGVSNVTAIAAGGRFTMARKSDGSVWVFGSSQFGQLGQGNTTSLLVPTQMPGITTATAVAAGGNHSLVLLADGTVKASGYNQQGQLGDSTTTQRTSPVTVSGLTGVAAIAAGGGHSAALKTDATLRLWGQGTSGQIGDNATSNRTSATAVTPPTNVALVALGGSHSLAVTSTGVVSSWGANTASELGDGTTIQRQVPDTISGPNFDWKVGTPTFNTNAGSYTVEKSVVVAVATPSATIHYTLNGTDPTQSDPTVASGGTVLIDESRTLKARAFNGAMPASNITTAVYTLTVAVPSFSPTPTTYTTPRTVTLATTSPGATLRFTLDGSTPTAASAAYTAPFSVGTTTTVKVIGMRTGWSSSSVNSGTYTMNFGTLAAPGASPAAGGYTSNVTVTLSSIAGATVRYTTNGSTPNTNSPAYTAPLVFTTTTTLKAIAYHPDYVTSPMQTAAYTITAAVPTFTPPAGAHPAGQMITVATATAGATIRYTTTGVDPTDTDPVIASGGTLPVGNFTLKARASFTGATTSAVTSSTYTVTGDVATPAIDAGLSHTVAVRTDGSAFAWGNGGDGVLGNGASNDAPNPLLISGLTGVTQISAGGDHSLARRSDGRVLAWGSNGSGRLGDGTTTTRYQPVFVSSVTTATMVSAGIDHSLILLADGTVLAFGNNTEGQLGLGDTTSRSTPTPVPGLSGIVAVRAGWAASWAVTNSGAVYAFGQNADRQLCLGDTTDRTTPTLVSSLTGVADARASFSFSAVLLASGAVRTCGAGSYGQLGHGGFGYSGTPVAVVGLSDATAIALGTHHAVARRSDGTVVVWGSGGYGALGDGTGDNAPSPIVLPGLTDVAGVGAGGSTGFAWSSSGQAWAWGTNGTGQLGDSTETQRDTPVPISGAGFNWKVWTPTLSVASGTYPTDQSVAVSCTDPVWAGATTLHYTTTGSVPTETDPTVSCGGSVAVPQSLTLRVNGRRAGAPTSELTAASYVLQAPPPTLSPGTGAYPSAQTVTLSTATAGATLRYTLDGTEPTLASPQYTAPVSVGTTTTLKAIVFKTGWTPSVSGAASYWIAAGTVATPTITPTSGTYPEAPMVTIVSATAGATIRVTFDGTDPTVASPAYSYPFMLPAGSTVKAKAFKAGLTPSATAASLYAVGPAGAVAPPILSPGSGRFTTRQTITVTGPAGATLRYTTTGVDPTTSDATVASGATISVDRSLVLKVRAFQSGLTDSAVRRADYVITGALGMGYQHGAAVKADRTVWAWGRGSGLPLVGDGGGVNRLSPVAIPAAGPALTVAVAFQHTLVLKDNGTVVGWGTNSDGQLGDNSSVTRSTPVVASGLSNVVGIAAGDAHSLAVTASGQVFAWGANARGQLGNANSVDHLVPTLVAGISGAVAVAAGEDYSLVITSDGATGGVLWAFGANDVGQLADGTTVDRVTPVRVLGVEDVIAIDAARDWAVIKTADGRAWTIGTNADGQRGIGSTATAARVATPLLAIAGADLVSAGDSAGLATDRTPRLWYWGGSPEDLGGDGPASTPHYAPYSASSITSALALAVGSNATLAARVDGSVWSTGSNLNGSLGIGVSGSVSSWTSTSGLTLASNTWLTTDPDGDGLPVWREYLLGTDPLNADTNGNGVPDGADASTGSAAANPDVDGDGLSWVQEAARGTDPYQADSDGDGVGDLLDLFPLDPTRTALPPPTPGDTTPPVITLIEPTNAVPVP
jgi:alpha-tubulin suppressor-like RCC1 family protein